MVSCGSHSSVEFVACRSLSLLMRQAAVAAIELGGRRRRQQDLRSPLPLSTSQPQLVATDHATGRMDDVGMTGVRLRDRTAAGPAMVPQCWRDASQVRASRGCERQL